MATPMFRASQSQSNNAPSFKYAPVSLSPVQFQDGRVYVFTHLSTENADVYSPPHPSVRWIVRIAAAPSIEIGSDGRPKHPTYFEPSWFSIHIFWEWLQRGEIENRGGNRGRALAEASWERVIEYLGLHPYPTLSEEYDPIVLEIY